MVMARSVQLHPVVVILAVLAMGDLLGLAGVILAVPTAAVVTVLLEELYVKPLGAAPSPRAAELPEEGDERRSEREGEREEKTPASRS
jgi:predicted PurR-regulated permease PerM